MQKHPEVVDFSTHLRLKNLAPRTATEYVKVLRSLFSYLDLGDSAPRAITTPELREYVMSLQKRGLSDKTVSTRVLVIKRFFGFLLTEGYVEKDPSLRLPRPKVGKRLPRALPVPQVQSLFAAFKGDTPVQRRDRIFFQLTYACGLRLSETASIKLIDINFIKGTLRVVGKGNRERQLYLKPNVLQALKEYVSNTQPETYLFPGQGGDKAISARNMSDRFRNYVRAAGLPDRVTTHTLRHSIAVHYLIQGAPITFVQKLLGHASLATTGIYTQLADDMTRTITLSIPTALDQVIPWTDSRGGSALSET